MFSKINKTKKSFIVAIAMSLILLMGSALGVLIESNLGQITKPLSGTWADYAVKPVGSGIIHSDATMDVNDPYLIYTPEELAYIIKNSSGKHIKLMADIDLSGHEWEPITNPSYPTSVFIYGNNHVISNLTINQPTKDNIVFFGVAVSSLIGNMYDNIYIQDLIFSNVDIVGNNYVGVVSGRIGGNNNSSKITNVQVSSGVVCGNGYVGGIVGSLVKNATIVNSVNNARLISETGNIGGIAGDITNVIIRNCINTGDILSRGDRVGGIVGYFSESTVDKCYVNCKINTSSSGLGGIAGMGTGTLSYSGANVVFEMSDISVSYGGPGSIAGSISGSTAIFINCYGVADFYIGSSSADISWIKPYGATTGRTGSSSQAEYTSCYSFSRIYQNNVKTEIRKYKVGISEAEPFSEFAYSKNINGGYPFPKSLFAVGQFMECDTMSYLEEYGFEGISIKNDGSHYYIELGQYPQSYVGGSLNSELSSWYSNAAPQVAKTFLNPNRGSISTQRSYEAYVYTDGETYLRIPSADLSSYSGSDLNSGEHLDYGGTYWFKVEPIKWFVLNYPDLINGEKAILISENALAGYFNPNVWSSSDIRTWLNDTFINQAFDDSERGLIQATTLSNNSASSPTTGTGTSTTDNVWILSYEQIIQYLPTETDRACVVSDFCIPNYCSTGSLYALRTMSSGYDFAYRVSPNGVINTSYGQQMVLRPSLTLSI